MSRSVTAEIQDIIERRAENGGAFWSRADGSIHAPAGFSTIDVLNVLGELGATVRSHPILGEATEFVLRYQTPDGAFHYTSASSKLPCITGQVLAGLGRLGLGDDARYAAGLSWLLDHQADDGGWRCGTVRLGRSPVTDASNPGATLFVLDAFRFGRVGQGASVPAQLDRAVGSLLRHWDTKAPLGPCLFGIGSRFMKVEYPFLRYNLFYYVYVLSHFQRARADHRFVEALRELETHTQGATALRSVGPTRAIPHRASMVVDAPHHHWQSYSFARKGQPSALATARWEQIQANVTNDRPG